MQPDLPGRAQATFRGRGLNALQLLRFAVFPQSPSHMIELNPIRARIADLTGRLDALRGYL